MSDSNGKSESRKRLAARVLDDSESDDEAVELLTVALNMLTWSIDTAVIARAALHELSEAWRYEAAPYINIAEVLYGPEALEQLADSELADSEPSMSRGGAGFSQAHAVYRVVQAMNDGSCPSCGFLADRDAMVRVHVEHDARARRACDLTCPSCGFTVTASEQAAAQREFLPYMAQSLELFERWREDRDERKVPSRATGNSPERAG